jgi:hypothetical protein
LPFLSSKGKAIIAISLLALPNSFYLILISSNVLTPLEFTGLIIASLLLFLGGVYAGLLGIPTEELAARIESLTRPPGKTAGGNLIRAVCPVDKKRVVFVHVSPSRRCVSG